MLFYQGDQFPEYFKKGAFIVWHGSWNRAPIQQAGYKITFSPFTNDMPTRNWQDFADGFKGREVLENPADAAHRPTGIAEGINGEIYISSTVSGRVWQIKYVGE